MYAAGVARLLIIAASGRSAAERWAGSAPATVVTKDEIQGIRALRRMVREGGFHEVVVHTSSWDRQLNPQLYLTWLAAAPVPKRAIADDERGAADRLPASELARRSAAGAALAPVGIAEAAAELMPLPHGRRVGRAPSAEPAVLTIWLGGAEASVGGSVTHLSGILSGYRAH